MLKAEQLRDISLEEKLKVMEKQIWKKVEAILDEAVIQAIARWKDRVRACIEKPWYLEPEDVSCFLGLNWYEEIRSERWYIEDDWHYISVEFKIPQI